MPFAPINQLLDELRAGRMVVIVDDEDRENEGDLIMAAECVRPADINFMVTHARGLVCLALTRERCAQLGLQAMVRDNGSRHRTAFTASIEAATGVSTGISAHDRAHTIRTAVAAATRPSDLVQPGHVFPLMAQPAGVLNRAGHTEAACDLARLAGFEPAGVLVEILDVDGSMARTPKLAEFARLHGLMLGSIEDLIRHRLATEHTIERVETRDIETDFGAFALFVYRDLLDGVLHLALQRGAVDAASPTLVRVQPHNPLTDALRWRRADLGMSAADSLARIAADGAGVLVLLGEPQAADTLLARIRDQAPPPSALHEWRRNGAGSQILADLGCRDLRVLGKPRKQVGLGGYGLRVIEYVER